MPNETTKRGLVKILRSERFSAFHEMEDPLCIAAADQIDHLNLVMRECCDAIRAGDEFDALRMLEVALKEPTP